MYSLGQFNKCSTVGTHYCWDCLRWCDVVRSSTTAAAWRLVSRRQCSSLRRCRTRSEPNRSLHPSDQTQSESVYLRTQRSTGSPSGLKQCRLIRLTVNYLCKDLRMRTQTTIFLSCLYVGISKIDHFLSVNKEQKVITTCKETDPFLWSRLGNSCPRSHTPGCSDCQQWPQNSVCWSECFGQPGQWSAVYSPQSYWLWWSAEEECW